jgi:hypothetical protein
MSQPHGDARWSNTELRNHLEKAHSSARDKWGAYLSDLALAYWDAYKHVDETLKNIEALKKARIQQAELFWSIVLPAVAGGFLGGLVSLRLKDVLKESGLKFIEHSLLIDTGKTVTSDVAKYETRKKLQQAVDANPWKPASIDPAQFGEILRGQLLHFMVRIDDQLIDQKSPNYRDTMLVLYNSPFIWNAPEEKDLVKWKENLWRPLEVFLWADWANHRDTQYWLKRILAATDKDLPWDDDYDTELMDFNPMLDRLIQCNVPRNFITQDVRSYRYTLGDTRQTRSQHPFLNILWLRHLAPHYKDTLLGKLLTLIAPGGIRGPTAPADLSLRPGSYPLM